MAEFKHSGAGAAKLQGCFSDEHRGKKERQKDRTKQQQIQTGASSMVRYTHSSDVTQVAKANHMLHRETERQTW